MKTKLILLVLCMLCFFQGRAQSVMPTVNENVELMGVLAKLAGYREYNMNMGGQYIKNIDKYFKDHTNHPAVQRMKELKPKSSIGYDAVMSMAIHLENRNGHFGLLEVEQNMLDSRWDNADKDEFFALLDQFYNDTKFNDFFVANQPIYQKGLQAFYENVSKHLDTSWYSSFYGKEPTEKFSVVIGFCNGGGCYGPSRYLKGAQKEVFAIIGYFVDENDVPEYNEGMVSTLVHEFNHSFVNYLLGDEQNHKNFEEIGKELYNLVAWTMKNQAYGAWGTVINESIVRAAEICYLLDHEHTQGDIRNYVLYQMQRGFRWMPELVMLLREYEKNQSEYKTLENFYPHIIEFFADYVDKESQKINMIE